MAQRKREISSPAVLRGAGAKLEALEGGADAYLDSMTRKAEETAKEARGLEAGAPAEAKGFRKVEPTAPEAPQGVAQHAEKPEGAALRAGRARRRRGSARA